MIMAFDWQSLLLDLNKLVLAAFMGGAIGFERETHGQRAGFRTNLLISLGACLVMLLSLNMHQMFAAVSSRSVLRVDPALMASFALAGMGFFCARVVVRGKGGVSGLTSAVGLWLSTVIGLSAGAGYVIPAFFTTLISLLVLFSFRPIMAIIRPDAYSDLTLSFTNRRNTLKRVLEILSDYPEISIGFINYKRNIIRKTVVYRLGLKSKEDLPWEEISIRLQEIQGLQEIEWEESKAP
jgi:putative Mg2+ transporter-C (MgtC) family protein